MNFKKNQFRLSIIILTAFFFTLPVKAQVIIGDTTTPQEFSLLEITTTNKNGGLRLPQLTSSDRASLETAFSSTDREAEGLVIYNTVEKCIEFWNGDIWVSLCCQNSSSGGSSRGNPPNPPGASNVFSVSILPSDDLFKASNNDGYQKTSDDRSTSFTATPLLCPENIVAYDWYINNEIMPRQSTPSNQFTLTSAPEANEFTVYVIAKNLSGNTATSDPVTVKVSK